MFNFDALARWWNLQMRDAKKPYWVLHRGSGGKAGQTLATHGTEDVDASWTALVDTITDVGNQGVYELIVVVRPGGINDTNGKREFPLRSSAVNGINQQHQPGIYGMNGYQAPAPPSVDIAGITAQIEEKYRLQNQIELQSIQHKHQMEKMEEMIEGISKSKQTGWERFLEMLENPEIAQGVIGMVKTVQSLLSPQPILQTGIGNVAAPPLRRRKPTVVEQPAAENPYPAPDSTEDEPDEDDETEGSDADFEPIPGLESDYDHALSAVNVLHAAGWEHPGDLLLKVSQFAIENPKMAKQMMANL